MGQTLRQSHPNAIAYPAVEVSTLNAGAPTMEAGNLYVTPRAWQPSTLSYVPLIVDAGGNLLVSGGGGGGGGAVTISDGSDVAEGSTTDAAVYGDVNGTVEARLRGMSAMMLGRGTANAPASASVTGSSAIVVAANASRKRMVIINTGTANVSFGDGQAAVNGNGITLLPGGTWVMDQFTFTTAAIYAISGTSSTLAIQEYQ